MDPVPTESFSFDWSYPIAFIWGLMVLVSLVGWGRAIGSWLAPDLRKQDFGWGLSAGWGMASFLILSGPMLMLSVFSAKFVTLFLLAGWGMQVWQLRSVLKNRDEGGCWNDSFNFPLKFLFIVLGLLILLTYAGAVAAREYDQYDDFAAYFYLTQRMLDLGTVFDPFSYRMLGALGGQITLSTLVFTYLPWKYANLLDYGIAGLIVLGLTQEFVRGSSRKAWIFRLFLLLLALTFPTPHTNTGSELTGCVLFITLFCTLELVATERLSGWRAAGLVGGAAVAAATLRCHNVFTVALLCAGFIVWRLEEAVQDRRTIVRESLQMLIIATVFILPWWIVSYRSGGTFLYPLYKGNHQPQFQIFEQNSSLLDNLQFTFGFFTSTTYLFLFLPLCFLNSGPQKRRLLIFAGVILLISAAFVFQFNMGTIMYFHAYRYLVPFGLAFGLYSSGCLARQLAEPSRARDGRFYSLRTKLAKIFANVMILFQSIAFIGTSIINIVAVCWATNSHNQAWCEGLGPIHSLEAEQEYPKAFACIPVGAKTFIALDYPFLVDNRAHAIFSLDVAGAASPPPGLPYYQGSTAVRNYLRAQGFRYIAHVPFDRSLMLHSRTTALRELSLSGPFFQLVGRYKLNFMDNIDELEKSEHILYDSPTIRIVDLQ